MKLIKLLLKRILSKPRRYLFIVVRAWFSLRNFSVDPGWNASCLSRSSLTVDDAASYGVLNPGFRNKFIGLLAILPVLFLTCSSLAAETNMLASVVDVSVLRSPTGHYVVVGTNSFWNASLMRWTDAVDKRIERLIGLKMSFDSRLIRIIVSKKKSGKAGVEWSQGYGQGKFIQQLIIYDYLQSDISQAEVALCGLFLNGYVIERQTEAGRMNSGGKPLPHDLKKVPSWLALGVARNLYSSYRAVNSSELIIMYNNGTLPTVNELIEQFSDSAQDGVLNKHVCGMFVWWLSKLPGHSLMFDKLFSLIADGEILTTERLITIIKDCDSVTSLEKMWRDWVSDQQRIIYNPGIITPNTVNKLRSVLLMTPDDCGNVVDITGEGLSFAELIPHRKEKWVAGCVRQKIINLKLSFVGRGNDMNKVVDSYCNFLAALEKRKSKKQLLKLLNKADNEFSLFSEKYSVVNEGTAK
jgi:hypothetical protein